MVTAVYLQQDDAQWELCRQLSARLFGYVGCERSGCLGEQPGQSPLNGWPLPSSSQKAVWQGLSSNSVQ